MNEETELADSNTAEDEILEDSTDQTDETQAELEKARELASNYRIRAEKAERLAKSLKAETQEKVLKSDAPAPTAGELSTKDLYALMENKVAQDDIDEVREYAQLKKISIAEALKTSLVKTLLSEKAEQRKTSEASNTGGSKRGSGKLSDDAFIAKIDKGDLPESDEDMQRYYKIRKGLK
jgi:Glu-tRNA(Gln) amidotransferase subunit E-like FAD-binding protein